MKRLGVLLILALCGCQTTGDVDDAVGSNPVAGNQSCAQSRLILSKYYLTPHQRADLVESMRANGCGE